MNPNISFSGYPIGAGMLRGTKRWEQIIDLVDELPKSVRQMIASPQTASFIRGLVKTYQLPPEKGRVIAYAVLRVALGEKTIAQLSSVLSTEVPLPNDKAQRMAKEIEEDLFGPVRKELEESWQRQKNTPKPDNKKEMTTGKASKGGARNVLNLREEKKPPVPPPMPQV